MNRKPWFRKSFPFVASALAVLLGLTCLLRTHENPAYQNWKQFKPGSWIKMKSHFGGALPYGEQVQKLLEVTPAKVVVELTSRATGNASVEGLPPRTARLEIGSREEHSTIESEGDEEIVVSGKTLKCHWQTWTEQPGKIKQHFKAWTYPSAPGGLVRMDLKTEGGGEMTTIALEWEGK